jgi:parvulin-like peptidyl-prolyl isomerase
LKPQEKTVAKKQRIAIAIIVFVLASLGFVPPAIKAVFSLRAASAAATEPDSVATIDGKPIPTKIFRMYLKNGIAAFSLNAGTDNGRRQIELLKQGIVSELIDRALVEAEARRRNLSISDEAFARAHKKTIDRIGGEQQYRTHLVEHGLSDEEFRQTITQDLYGELLKHELDKEVSVTEAEIRDFYNKQKKNQALLGLFKEPERVQAQHVLIAARRSQIAAEIESGNKLNKAELEPRVASELTRRRALADSILGKLKSGGDFAAVARQYSDDPGTKQKGGDLGLFCRNTHTKEFDEAAFCLRPGRLSGVVETEYGYHIIKVTKHLPERPRALDEVRSEIQSDLLKRKQAEHVKGWLNDRRSHADIHVNESIPLDQQRKLDSGL